MSATTSELYYINGATLHKRSQTCFSQLSVFSFRTTCMSWGGGGEHDGLISIIQRNLNSSTQQTGSIHHAFKQKSNRFTSPLARLVGVLISKTTQGFCSIPFMNCNCRLSSRSNSIPFFLIEPFKEEKEMKILSTYIFALRRMLTRYNFTAARDPEMLHKIYKSEPKAQFIETPRCILGAQKNPPNEKVLLSTHYIYFG